MVVDPANQEWPRDVVGEAWLHVPRFTRIADARTTHQTHTNIENASCGIMRSFFQYRELTWKWRMAPWMAIFHYKQVVFHFHVSSRESKVFHSPLDPRDASFSLFRASSMLSAAQF